MISKILIEKIILILNIEMNWKTYGFHQPSYLSAIWSAFTNSKPFWLLGGGWGNLKILKVLKNDNTSWKRVGISSVSALKSLGWWVGGGCIYDYSVNLSPNLWLMTFDLDLDLDLGLTNTFEIRVDMGKVQNFRFYDWRLWTWTFGLTKMNCIEINLTSFLIFAQYQEDGYCDITYWDGFHWKFFHI